MSDKYIIRGPEPLTSLPNKSVGEVLLDSLRGNINRHQEALVDAITKEGETFENLQNKSIQVAIALRKFGLGPKDIAVISSENSIPYFYPVLGSLFVGATVAPLNIGYIKDELGHALKILDPKIVFCSKYTVHNFLNIKKEFPSLKKIVLINSEDCFEGVDTLKDFIGNCNTKYVAKFQPTPVDVQETATILFSSGTTGLPKGVMLSQENAHSFLRGIIDPRFLCPLGPGEIIMGQLPFYHGYGCYVSLSSILTGSKMVILQKFEPQLFLKTIQEYKVTTVLLVPPIALLLAKHPIVDMYDISSIRYVICGAAPLRKEIEILVKKRLNITIYQGYGLTEVSISSVLIPVGVTRPGSVGKLWADMEAKIRDPETGKSLGPNQVGEICFRGKMVMKGYYKNEEATRSTMDKDGFFCTGDVAYYDEEGYFYVVDRLKELIKYKGFQVPPAELEAILTKHPKIIDAGVIGVLDDEAGELPLAFVVKVPGCSLTEKEVQDFVAGQVSNPKRLRGGVIFIDQIPKSPSGKILRNNLRKLLTTTKSKL